jgi:hypothetical protein
MGYYQIADMYPHLKNPQKYRGARPITARSGWEISFIAKYLDVNENILEWSSEEVVVPYVKPTDNKVHRYFMDFSFKAKCKDGSIQTFWVEIKPFSQTQPVKEPKRKTRKYLEDIKTYFVNQAKWQATRELIEQKKAKGEKIEFQILTEKECPFFLR